MEPLTTVEIAQARHHTYLLLSRLYLEGLTADLLPFVRAVPALAATIAGSLDPDQAAAAHYRLFGLNVFPYASVFLDPAGLLGGATSVGVARRYHDHGYQVDADTAPDHIGHELGYLAHLCAVEAETRTAGQQQRGQQLAAAQQAFLAQHLSRWLAPFVVALGRQETPFYRALATLTWEIAADHLRREPVPWSLPPLPDLADDESITLRRIAATLLSPPLGGFFLSRETIGSLGRRQNLPRGFGGRQQILLNLMRSAAQYDQFPALLEALRQEAGLWGRAYAALPGTNLGLVAPWQERIAETSAVLVRLAAKADTLA